MLGVQDQAPVAITVKLRHARVSGGQGQTLRSDHRATSSRPRKRGARGMRSCLDFRLRGNDEIVAQAFGVTEM